MARITIILILLFIFLTLLPITSYSSDANNEQGYPYAFLPSDKHTFETVLEGVTVIHDFIIENRGEAPLKILRVKPGCGCTTASFTEVVPPQGSGKITLRFNTKGYGGNSVKKKTLVTTNDPVNPSIYLIITGHVDHFADITPKKANLSGTLKDTIKKDVTIIPNKKYPFEVLGIRAEKGENIGFALKKIKVQGNPGYLLSIVNLRKVKGKYDDAIYIETDSDLRPEISIKVSGNIK